MKTKHLILAATLAITLRAEDQYDLLERPRLKHQRLNLPLITGAAESTCSCTTEYFTYTGEGILYTAPQPQATMNPDPQPTHERPLVVETSVPTHCPPPATVTVTETKYITVTPDPVRTEPIGPKLVYQDPTSPISLQPTTKTEPPVVATSITSNIELTPPKPTSDAQVPSTPQTGHLGSDSGLWAITFSPFNDDGKCKSETAIWEDVKMIRLAGFKAIRVYGTECSGIEHISSAVGFHGLKLIIGIFISETGCSGAAEQVTHITKWAKWEIVELIVIGNEALFNGHTSSDELAKFISSTKTILQSSGYNGPCTTAEPLNIWQKNSDALCDAVDIVGCNIHPFFNPEVDASHAGPFVKSQLEIVEKICPGKRGVNLECGWPSAGDCNGKACPGKVEQKIAVDSIQSFAGNLSVMFTYSNDYWKSPGAFKVEQSFGLIKLLTSH